MTNTPETNQRDTVPPHIPADVLKRRRKRKAQWVLSGMLSLSLLIVVMGIYTSTRTESLSITGYVSGFILAFGSFLGVLGLFLDENRKQLLVAAIVFLSFGIVSSFLCLLIDGLFILLNIDMRPMKAGRCQFYTSGNSYIYENYYATVPCQGLTESCSMKVRSGTCYCCDLYDCANGGYLNTYYEFVGVQSCQEVLSLYILLWVLTLLNLLAFLFGILTTAVLGSIKDMNSGPDLGTPLLGGPVCVFYTKPLTSWRNALLMDSPSQVSMWSPRTPVHIRGALLLVALLQQNATHPVIDYVRTKGQKETPSQGREAVRLDVSRWGSSSLFSYEGGNCSSPTAPLLTDPNSLMGQQLYPKGSLYIPPAAGESTVSSGKCSDSSSVQQNPPPFAPLYNLLPYKSSSVQT
ncbi:hypothetical protein DNTS_023783 [Danionella cerebrum]|uniref:Uncharacterized protein n=1 Tax=Danionella cerebrum TaxID=2873325 RepID=A0A553QV70_9TELE|nr:hypothetical protein DNTS_023783 [Danionella translucida]